LSGDLKKKNKEALFAKEIVEKDPSMKGYMR